MQPSYLQLATMRPKRPTKDQSKPVKDQREPLIDHRDHRVRVRPHLVCIKKDGLDGKFGWSCLWR